MYQAKLNHTVAVLKQKVSEEEEGLANCLPWELYALGLDIFALAG